MNMWLVVFVANAFSRCFAITDTFEFTWFGSDVKTTLGKVSGTRMELTSRWKFVHAFYGIPYAADTSGSKRFKVPQIRASWSGTMNVQDSHRTVSGSCLQEGNLFGSVQGTEDCLRLHVYSPKLPSSNGPLLPVMVFLHGGSFLTGNGKYYDAYRFLNEDVVLVVPHYRLGIFGFLTTHTDEAPGNMGLYDQQAALGWVRDNIANFGGDPKTVTLFGQSAGARCVGHHIISPLSAGLFHRAILQSGSAIDALAIEENPLAYHEEFGKLVGCPWDQHFPEVYVECLRRKTGSVLIRAQSEQLKAELLQGRHGFRGVSPVVQTTGGGRPLFISETPIVSLTEGRFNRVPTIMGATKHEGTFLLGRFYKEYLIPKDLLDNRGFLQNGIVGVLAQMFEVVKDTDAPEDMPLIQELESTYLGRLPSSSFNEMIPGLVDLLSVLYQKRWDYNMALQIASHGVPAWFYSFEFNGQKSMYRYLFNLNQPPLPAGIGHADDLIYQWHIPFMFLWIRGSTFSRDFIRTWTQFALKGTMDSSWPALTPSTKQYLVLDLPRTVRSNYPDTFTVATDEHLMGEAIP